jgi:UDP-N-acetylglucosamine/UDP-N-acetylgalactosamine diphosphorylase
MTISYERAYEQLREKRQEHVLAFWDRLTEKQRAGLLRQIEDLDFDALDRMQAVLQEEAVSAPKGDIEPPPVLTIAEQDIEAARSEGERLLRQNRVGALLVAGGQGSRLGFDGPKGAYLLGPLSNASLFEMHARKILAREQRYGCEIPFYIMTSETNDADTRAFFEQHDFFGLSHERVMFFTQGMWPALDPQGRIMLDGPDHVFRSPDGHGGVLAALQRKGMLDDMRRRGLDLLFYFQVDNALVDIADPTFLGLHHLNRADISVKVCAKRDATEGLGVVAVRDGRNLIVEYSELSDEQMHATGPDGHLLFRFGSVAIHVFALDFVRRETDAGLPLHLAHKKIPTCDVSGETVTPDAPNGYKFEKFIFDVLPDAERSLNVEFRREAEFSPLKNASGKDSAQTARRDMTEKFARWFEAAGIDVPRDDEGLSLYCLEIDPCYALDAGALKAKLPDGFRITGDVLLK